jgi:hypothetical protein
MSNVAQGERGQEHASSIANVKNKANSPVSKAPAEVYAQACAQPLPRVRLRPLPGQFMNAENDRT